MVLLSAATMNNCQDVYNKNQTINEGALNAHLSHLKSSYGNTNALLCNIIENCLMVDEHQRLNCCEIKSQVPPYADIVNHFKNGDHSPSPQRHYQQESYVETGAPVYQSHQEVVRRNPVVTKSYIEPYTEEPMRNSSYVQRTTVEKPVSYVQNSRVEQPVYHQSRVEAPVEIRRSYKASHYQFPVSNIQQSSYTGREPIRTVMQPTHINSHKRVEVGNTTRMSHSHQMPVQSNVKRVEVGNAMKISHSNSRQVPVQSVIGRTNSVGRLVGSTPMNSSYVQSNVRSNVVHTSIFLSSFFK